MIFYTTSCNIVAFIFLSSRHFLLTNNSFDMNKLRFSLFAIAISSLLFTACEKEDPVIENEEEVITTLNYTLAAQDGSGTVTLTFRDLDGDGGNAPVITGGTLAANTSYTGAVTLLNEQESPAENVTEEIEEENDEHQFFFSTSVNGVSISYADTDGAGDPVGLVTTLNTGDAGNGSLTVTLIHEPNKAGEGVSDGLIANAGGETDIEVTFPIDVQ